MKNLILIFLFLLLSLSSYSQIIKDTVFIRFNDKIDLVKRTEKRKTNIWLFNILYEKELKQYKKDMPFNNYFPVQYNAICARTERQFVL